MIPIPKGNTVVCIVGMICTVSAYGIYAFTHPSINGMALASVIGVIGLLGGLSYRELKNNRG